MKKVKYQYQYVGGNEYKMTTDMIKSMFDEMVVECGKRCFTLMESEGGKMTPAEKLCMERCMKKQITIEKKIRTYIEHPIADLPNIRTVPSANNLNPEAQTNK